MSRRSRFLANGHVKRGLERKESPLLFLLKQKSAFLETLFDYRLEYRIDSGRSVGEVR
jgi:hypothetical protein